MKAAVSALSDDKVKFYVKYGNIELKNLFIGKGINKKLKKAKIFDKGSHLQFTISRNN